MPLDDVGGRYQHLLAPRTTLAGALADHGIEPVPLEYLKAHREEQVRLNPPSFLYRHRWVAPGLTMASFLVSIGAAALVGTSQAAVSVILGGMLPALAGIVLASRRVRGEAYWTERRISEHGLETAGVPQEIGEIAHNLKRQVPTARLVLGELRQDTVLLDPYLVAEYGDERVVLGIWDGDTIITCAG
jgi:hypothetical protein